MSETIVKGKAAVAEHFGVSVRQVRNWEQAGMPGRSGRSYDLVKIQLWRDQRQGKGGGGHPQQGFLSAERGAPFHEARLKKAKASLAERELAIIEGRYVAKSEIERMWGARAMIYRQGMVNLEQILPPRIAAALHLPPESMRQMASIVHQVTGEVLANVLRAGTLTPEMRVEDDSER